MCMGQPSLEHNSKYFTIKILVLKIYSFIIYYINIIIILLWRAVIAGYLVTHINNTMKILNNSDPLLNRQCMSILKTGLKLLLFINRNLNQQQILYSGFILVKYPEITILKSYQ